MNKRQAREFATIERARSFFRMHHLESGPFRVITKTLDDVIERVYALNVAASVAAAPTNTEPMRELKDDLRLRHMLPLSRRGRTLFRGEVRIENALRVPHATARPAVILAAARDMAKAIQPHRQLFLEAGAPKTFLADLRAASARLAAFVKVVDERSALGPAAFQGLRDQIRRGREEISVADGQVIAWLRAQSAAVRSPLGVQWRAARRIRSRTGRPRKRARAGGT